MIDRSKLLQGLPAPIVQELWECLDSLATNYRECRWEPAELNGGKLCEVTVSILQGIVAGTIPTHASKPANMVTACRQLEQASTTFPRSVRILLPRAIQFIYEVRNNRGVGHVGGDISSNDIDAHVVYETCRWMVAELIRVFEPITLQEAREACIVLAERPMQLIWQIEGVKRVLKEMPVRDQIMVLLYQGQSWTSTADLLKWTEYSNPTRFRKEVLQSLHSKRLIEFDSKGQKAAISPTGIALVENTLLSKVV